MSEKMRKNMPAKGWNIPAAILAVLLTMALWATQLGAVSLWVVSSQRLHERVALSQESIDHQMTRIEAEISAIGEIHHFDPAPVTAAVTRESVELLNRQTVAWWTGFGATGELQDPPTYHADLKENLMKDQGFMQGLEETTINSTIEQIEARVDEAVRKSVVMVRDELIQGGLQRVTDRVDIPKILEIIRKLPGLGAAASLLLAGLIALMMSRRIQVAGQFIGGALSGCGLLMLLTLGLLKALHLEACIGEASAALQAQYHHLARILTMETIGLAALLMIVGGLLMAWAARTMRKYA